MKKKKKKKKSEIDKKEIDVRSLSPSYRWLVANIIIWVFIGLLWVVWKAAWGTDVTGPGTAGFRYLLVYGLGFGFSIISALDAIWHK